MANFLIQVLIQCLLQSLLAVSQWKYFPSGALTWDRGESIAICSNKGKLFPLICIPICTAYRGGPVVGVCGLVFLKWESSLSQVTGWKKSLDKLWAGHPSCVSLGCQGTAAGLPERAVGQFAASPQHVKAALARRKLPFLQPFKQIGREGKSGFCLMSILPSMCGQEQVSCEGGWMVLSTAGFQPGSAVLCNWFDPSFLLLERASVSGASQVKSLLQGLLDSNAFLESDRSCLIIRSLRSSFHPKLCWKCHRVMELSFWLLVGCLFHDCFRSNPDKEIQSQCPLNPDAEAIKSFQKFSSEKADEVRKTYGFQYLLGLQQVWCQLLPASPMPAWISPGLV